jgi:hypothetical protein
MTETKLSEISGSFVFAVYKQTHNYEENYFESVHFLYINLL